MKLERDMDFVRELLLRIESGETSFETTSSEDAIAFLGYTPEIHLSREEADKLRYHIDRLEQAGFIEIGMQGGAGHYSIKAITWEGHDFLDSVRDSKTWAKTKKGALSAGGFSVDLLKDLAKGFVKKQIEERTGVQL